MLMVWQATYIWRQRNGRWKRGLGEARTRSQWGWRRCWVGELDLEEGAVLGKLGVHV